MPETFNPAPFTELVMDVFRNLCICGDREGRVFLATQEFCDQVLEEYKAQDLKVIHVEDAYPYFRLPARGDDVLGPQDEVIEIEKCVMAFGGGFYMIRAGYSHERKIWIVSGDADWYSPLRMELARNEVDDVS